MINNVCPISPEKVDSHVARLNGFFTLCLLAGGWFFYPLWVFVAVDFLARSTKIKFSLIARVSRFILNLLNIEPKPISLAPKKFAARLGLTMSLALVLFTYFGIELGIWITLGMFVTAVSLETFFDYCLGCKIYGILASLGLIKIK